MNTAEPPKPTLAELQRLHHRQVAEQVFRTQQLLGSADSGSDSHEEIEAKLRESQMESHRILMEIVGPPWQGVVVGPNGAEIIDFLG